MVRDPRYDVLFDPVKIGPVTAKNRFYPVPHCNGLGYRRATSRAATPPDDAEGGWAVGRRGRGAGDGRLVGLAVSGAAAMEPFMRPSSPRASGAARRAIPGC